MRLERIAAGGLVLCAISCDPAHEQARPVSPLVGRWVQVFPALGALDTLWLREDGMVVGLAAGLDDTGYALERWKLGSTFMPGGLCLGEALSESDPRQPQFLCQAFSISGDTLWLANRSQTVFLRYRPTDATRAIAPWPALTGAPIAPRPGEEAGSAPGRALHP